MSDCEEYLFQELLMLNLFSKVLNFLIRLSVEKFIPKFPQMLQIELGSYVEQFKQPKNLSWL